MLRRQGSLPFALSKSCFGPVAAPTRRVHGENLDVVTVLLLMGIANQSAD